MAFVVFQIEAHSWSGHKEGRHYLRIENRCSCTCQDLEPIKHVAFRSKQMYSLISVRFSVLFLIEKDILLHFGYLPNIFAGQITGRCRETYHILNDLYILDWTCAHCHSLLRAHTQRDCIDKTLSRKNKWYNVWKTKVGVQVVKCFWTNRFYTVVVLNWHVEMRLFTRALMKHCDVQSCVLGLCPFPTWH